jgi:hypothetical protein
MTIYFEVRLVNVSLGYQFFLSISGSDDGGRVRQSVGVMTGGRVVLPRNPENKMS